MELENILPLPSPTPPRSDFESLPTELRLQIYSLLLNAKPEYCHLERSRSYSTPKLYPAILAVNRSISAEAYPILYGENTFLFLGSTIDADKLNAHQESLGRLVGLPKLHKQSLLPEQSRHLIKDVAAAPLELERIGWPSRLLHLAPAIKTIQFDFWLASYRHRHQTPYVLESIAATSTLDASIPAIQSLISASTQIFRIGARNIAAYYESTWRFWSRESAGPPGMQLAVVDLKGLHDVQVKRRLVHKVLNFIIKSIRQRRPWPNKTMSPGQAVVSVEKRLYVHRDLAGFWSSEDFEVPERKQGWNSVDSNGQSVEIGRMSKSVTWRRSEKVCVTNKAFYGYMDPL